MHFVKIYLIYFLLFAMVYVFAYAITWKVWERKHVTKKDWANYPIGNEVHTVPRHDHISHTIEDCVCSPKTVPVERKDGSIGWSVVHNALDGRL